MNTVRDTPPPPVELQKIYQSVLFAFSVFYQKKERIYACVKD